MAGSATSTINLGSVMDNSFSITITDTNVTATSYVEAFVMVDSTVDNDTEAHRHAAASWKLSTLPATGSFTLYIDGLIDLCWGTFKIRYAWA